MLREDALDVAMGPQFAELVEKSFKSGTWKESTSVLVMPRASLQSFFLETGRVVQTQLRSWTVGLPMFRRIRHLSPPDTISPSPKVGLYMVRCLPEFLGRQRPDFTSLAGRAGIHVLVPANYLCVRVLDDSSIVNAIAVFSILGPLDIWVCCGWLPNQLNLTLRC